MMKLDLISSSVAISVFLLFYYASVSVLTIYWVVTFNRTTPQANGINVWFAAFLSGGLVLAGFLSDLARVRKPFMLVGAVCAMVMMVFLIVQTDHPHTGYYANVLVIVLLAVSIALAYAPWMANYTEQVESHNPALTASGLAVWGWILRITVALSFLVLPYVITTSTVLVDNQTSATALQAIQAAEPYAPSTSPPACNPAAAPASVITGLQATGQAGPETLATLLGACNTTHDLTKALTAAGGLTNPQVQGLLAYNPLALAIQNGQAGEPGRDRIQGGRALAEPGEPARRRAEAGAGAEGLARRVEAMVGGVPGRPAGVRGPRLLHAGPLEPAGRPGATSSEHERMVTEELAKLAAAAAGDGVLRRPDPRHRAHGHSCRNRRRVKFGIDVENELEIEPGRDNDARTGRSACHRRGHASDRGARPVDEAGAGQVRGPGAARRGGRRQAHVVGRRRRARLRRRRRGHRP